MRGAIKLFSIRGIEVKLHPTFFLLLLFSGFMFGKEGGGLIGAIWGMVLVCLLFLCIILHEMSHCLVAQHFGVKVRDITLLPIGGVASIGKLPRKPSQELKIALAGPPINLFLGIFLLIFLLLKMKVNFWEAMTSFSYTWTAMLLYLALLNILIALFNLTPAFPMDGGRIMRAFLAEYVVDYRKATKIAVTLGQIFAFLFFTYGLLHLNPFLVLIGIFVYFGASQEEMMVDMKGALKKFTVGNLLIEEVKTVSPQDNLGSVLQIMFHTRQEDFPVMEEGKLVGLLLRTDILSANHQFGPGKLVGEIMKRNFHPVSPTNSLTTVHEKMMTDGLKALPVVENGSVIGIITLDDIRRIYALISTKKGKGPFRL